MIYTKPIDKITWEDLERFCDQKISENACLDYKQDFTNKLECTIAAMANTLGGIILIGVEDDKQASKPVTPIKGITPQRGVEERVTNIILSNITPPLFPEIGTLLNPDKTKAAVIIRIPQSHQTPHAIMHNTKVYIRTGDRNSPEDLATIDRIEWLRDNRGKSLKLRDQVFGQARNHFDSFLSRDNIKKGQTQALLKDENVWMELSFCPVYPKESYLTPPEMAEIINKIQVNDYYRQGRFPVYDNSVGEILQNGAGFPSFHSDYIFYTEFNCFGLYFFKQLRLRDDSQIKNTKVIRESELFATIDQFIDSGIKFYEQIGYTGSLLFLMEVKNCHECALKKYFTRENYNFDKTLYFSPDAEIEYKVVIDTHNLEHEKLRLTVAAAQKISWTFGKDFNQEEMENFFQKTKSRH